MYPLAAAETINEFQMSDFDLSSSKFPENVSDDFGTLHVIDAYLDIHPSFLKHFYHMKPE